jgi:16S rRNA U516 pseudouridylate synthase RsuA-like enzyme
MQIGGIELDSELEPGDYRPLTDEEIASIQWLESWINRLIYSSTSSL